MAAPKSKGLRMKKRQSGGVRAESKAKLVARKHANMSRKQVAGLSTERRRAKEALKLAKSIVAQRREREQVVKTVNKRSHRTLQRDKQAAVMEGLVEAIQSISGSNVTPVSLFAVATAAILKDGSAGLVTARPRVPYLLNAISATKASLSTNFIVQKLDIVRQVVLRIVTDIGASDYTSLTKAYKLLVDFAVRSVSGPILDCLNRASVAASHNDDAGVGKAMQQILPYLPSLCNKAFAAVRSCEPSKFHPEITPLFAGAMRKLLIRLFTLDEHNKIVFGIFTGADDEWEDESEEEDTAVDREAKAKETRTAPEACSAEVLWALRFELLKLLPDATRILLNDFSVLTPGVAKTVANNVSEIVSVLAGRCVAEFAGFALRENGTVEPEQLDMLTSVLDPVVSQITEIFKTSSAARAQWPAALLMITQIFSTPMMTILKRSAFAESWRDLKTALPNPPQLPGLPNISAKEVADIDQHWSMKVLPHLFDVSPMSKLLLRVLDKLRCMDDPDLNSDIEDAMIALGNCVPFHEFFRVLSFNPHIDDNSGTDPWQRSYLAHNVWRKISHHDSLKFFATEFLPRIQQCEATVRQRTAEGRMAEVQQYSALRDQYWRICTGFAHFPVDFDEVSFRNIARAIVSNLDDANTKTSPAAHAGCAAIHVLCSGYSQLTSEDQDDDGDDETPEQHLGDVLLVRDDDVLHPHHHHFISRSTAYRVCSLISKYSKNIMPKLCNAAEGVEHATGSSILAAVSSFAKICQPAVMESVLNGVAEVAANVVAGVHTEATGLSVQRRMVLDIAVGIVPQLEQRFLEFLLDNIIVPAVMCVSQSADDSDEVATTTMVTPATIALQKKGYRLLQSVLEHRLKDVSNLMPRIVQLMRDSAATAQPPAMKLRLQCLMWSLDACKIFEPDMVVSFGLEFVDEVVLCARERSHAARQGAMDWIDRFYRYCESSFTTDGARGDVTLFHRVLAGLAGKTPLAVSATILVLGKLLWCSYERCPLSDHDISRLFAMVFGLVDHAAAEVRNAAVTFARTCMKVSGRSPRLLSCMGASASTETQVLNDAAADSPVAVLLRSIAVTVSQSHVASATRTQMQQLIEKVLERYEPQTLERLFPVGSRKFLHHVIRTQRRAERQHQREDQRAEERALVAELTKEGVALPEQDDGLDLLEEGGIVQLAARTASHKKRRSFVEDDGKDDADDGYHLDVLPEGKIRILTKDEKKKETAEEIRQSTAERLLRQASNISRGRRTQLQGPSIAAAEVNDEGKRRRTAETEDFENEELFRVHGNLASSRTADAAAKPSSITQRDREAKAVTRESKRHRMERDIKKGDEFASSAGLGDIKKGNTDPFAYVPLARSMLNKRNQAHRVNRFKSIDHKGLRGNKAKRLMESKGNNAE